MDGLPGLGAAGLVGAVVHDGDAGVNGVYDGAGVGEIEAVVGGEIEVDLRDGIVGADEGDLLVLGEVAEIEEAEAAKGDEEADGAGVFRVVGRPLGLGAAEGVGERAGCRGRP